MLVLEGFVLDLTELTDELVRGPLVGGGVEDTSSIKLEEFKALLLSGAAITIALGQVVQDGAVVRLGPGVPGEGHVTASLDRHRGLAGSSFLQRGQMSRLIVQGSQNTLWQMMSASPKELGSTKPIIDCQILHIHDCLGIEMLTVVLVLRVPTGSVGLVVDPLGGGAVNGLAVGSNALHVTVSRDSRDNSNSCEDGSSAGGVHLERHLDCGGRKGSWSVF
jgi:hypothetical protein